MKKLYATLFVVAFISNIKTVLAAELTEKSYHENIAEFVDFLAKKHPLPVSPQLQMNKLPVHGRAALHIILQRDQGKKIEFCLRALRDFDWENGKREDAPEGSKLAGRYAQFLALANETLGVIRQDLDDDGNLITTFSQPVSIEKIAAVYKQVPGVVGMVAEQPKGRCIMKHWTYQEIKETHAN